MNHSARVLAARSAPLAAAYCDQLREMLGTTIVALRDGRQLDALTEFERALDPMQKLLVFGVVVDSMLRDAQHPLRPSMKAFTQSLGAALEQAGGAVVERDFVEMHAVLATCVLPTLERYAEFGPRLTSALQPRLAG